MSGMTDEEAARLIAEHKRTGDRKLRDLVIEGYEGVARGVARCFLAYSDFADLRSEARVGIVKAFDTFDPSKDVTFGTWAWNKADGEVRHYVRDLDRTVRIPAWSQERMSQVRKAWDRASGRLKRKPTIAEVADEAGFSEYHVGCAIRAEILNADMVHLHGQVSMDEDSKTWEDVLPSDKPDEFDQTDTKIDVREAIQKLPQRQREFMQIYLDIDMESVSEAAKIMGISKSYGRYLQKHAFERMRRRLEDARDG
jgi:RNA polymerase sigma factor (sigma-70 family)